MSRFEILAFIIVVICVALYILALAGAEGLRHSFG